MSETPKEQHPNADKSEEEVDEEIKESFPASDPPSIGGGARIESNSQGSGTAHPAVKVGVRSMSGCQRLAFLCVARLAALARSTMAAVR